MTFRVLEGCCLLLAVVAAASSQAIEFSQDTYSVSEGNSVIISVIINSTLTSDLNVTVMITPANSNNISYSEADLSLTFPPNTTEQNFTIHAVSDTSIEGQETFTLEVDMLEHGSGYMIMPGAMAQLVVEDTTVRVGINGTPNTVLEGDTLTLMVAVLSGDVTGTFEVNVTTVNGTAASSDYMPFQQTLMFSPTVLSHSLDIVTNDDQEVDMLSEQFTISLSTTDPSVKLDPPFTVSITDTTIRLVTGLTNVSVTPGDMTNLTCVFESSNTLYVNWFKDNVNITNDGAFMIQTSLGPQTYTSSLLFNTVSYQDCGSFYCMAVSQETGGNLSTITAVLQVIGLNSTSPPVQTVSVGSVVTLLCRVDYCGTPPTIEWGVNDDNNFLTLRVENEQLNDSVRNVSSLLSTATLDTVGVDNEGIRQWCRVFDTSRRRVLQQRFSFNVRNIEVEVTPATQQVVQGKSFNFTCSATAPPGVEDAIFSFIWYRSNDSSRYGEATITNFSPYEIIMEPGGNASLLIVDGLFSFMTNWFVCAVTIRDGNDTVYDNGTMFVQYPPRISFPDTLVVLAGINHTIECSVAAQPKVNFIVISVNNTVVARTPENSNLASLTYVIENPRLNMSGSNFTCVAGNSVGNTSDSFLLEVEDVPEMVNISTFTSTLLSLLAIKLEWVAPGDNNAPITKYTFTYCDNVGACNNATVKKPTATVPVIPNRNYSINIMVTNQRGESPLSDSGMFRGPIEGEADVKLSIDFITTNLAILTWDFPPLATTTAAIEPKNVPSIILLQAVTILNSTVSYRYAAQEMVVETSSRGDQTLLTELVPDELYTFNVSVVYEMGQINNIARGDLTQRMTQAENAPTTTPPPQPLPREDGILVRWNKLPIDANFVSRYAVFVVLAGGSGRRKRAAMPVFNASSSDTEYLYENPEPYKDYLVSVDGNLDINGNTGTVTALPEQTVTSAQQQPSPPRDLQDLDKTMFTSFSVDWLPPENPNGVITTYRVLYTSAVHSDYKDVSSPSSMTTRVSAMVTSVLANTAYMVSVTARNAHTSRSVASNTVTITTKLGVVPPTIRRVVSSNNDNTYSIFIDPFSDRYGHISHYFIYVVESRTAPNTTNIPQLDDNSAYIAAAYPANPATTNTPVTIGNGRNSTYNRKVYRNGALKAGTQYYFFIRLFSIVSQIPELYSDSIPMAGEPFPEEQKSTDIIPIVGGVLGAVAVILLIIFVLLILVACCGNRIKVYTLPRVHRMADGNGKGGFEMHRRTRLFSPVLNVGDPNAFTSSGQPTTLICEVSGTPAPTVTWTRGDKPLEDERFLLLADHSLFIQDTCLEDEGEYVVKAENSAGVSEAQIKVTVVKPSPPEPDVKHAPIPVDNFPEYHARLSANDAEDLEDEYADVEPDFPQTSYTARLQINRNKNRYINIIPYDHSRVVLPLQENTPGSDYINASYIDGYQKSCQYLATQGPTTSTLSDFWRMVWELDCPTIVMVTKLQEEDKVKCNQYWPSYGSTTYGNVQVTLKEAENLAEYSIRTFSISPLAGQSSAQMPVREVKQFHFLKWPDHGVPHYATALLHFRKRVNTYHPPKRGPMVVHCSAGVGRTGTFITVDYVMQQMANEGVVDIFNFVQQMRYKRNYMVQTASQYVFIHEAIDEAIRCGDTSIKAPQLKEWLIKLEKDADTGKDALESQFENLSVASPHDNEFECTVAEVNKEKNRIKEHLPSNDSRVVLSANNDQCDYICASTVDGYRQRNLFMVTQGPMENTVGDFWRMVWEHKSAAIVMLTELEEEGEEMSVKYWPDEVGQPQVFGLFSVELSSEVRDLGDYCTRKLKLSLVDKADESRIVTQFHFTKWTCSTPPPSAKPMIDMIDELQRVQRKSGNQPITVHCSNGLGRTGTFCTLYYVVDRVKTEQIVDVFQAVKTLRIQRTGLVDNLGQYEFVHRATVEFLDTFSDYQNFK